MVDCDDPSLSVVEQNQCEYGIGDTGESKDWDKVDSGSQKTEHKSLVQDPDPTPDPDPDPTPSNNDPTDQPARGNDPSSGSGRGSGGSSNKSATKTSKPKDSAQKSTQNTDPTPDPDPDPTQTDENQDNDMSDPSQYYGGNDPRLDSETTYVPDEMTPDSWPFNPNDDGTVTDVHGLVGDAGEYMDQSTFIERYRNSQESDESTQETITRLVPFPMESNGDSGFGMWAVVLGVVLGLAYILGEALGGG